MLVFLMHRAPAEVVPLLVMEVGVREWGWR